MISFLPVVNLIFLAETYLEYNKKMEIFRSEIERIKIIAIDENAYGPLIGPLLVTAVKIEAEGDPFEELKLGDMKFPFRFSDSKKVFQRNRSGYSAGEIAVHAILQAFGLRPSTFTELLKAVSPEALDEYIREGLGDRLGDVELPLWAKEIRDYYIQNQFEAMGIKPLSLRARVVFPPHFNRMIDDLDNKALLDLKLFISLLEELAESGDVALLGKIGGTARYGRFFEALGVEIKEIKGEGKGRSSYDVILGEREISLHFLLDADEIFLPVALASLLGKYIREIYMYLLARALGKEDPIPWASGYRHDSKTYDLLELAEKRWGIEARNLLLRKR